MHGHNGTSIVQPSAIRPDTLLETSTTLRQIIFSQRRSSCGTLRVLQTTTVTTKHGGTRESRAADSPAGKFPKANGTKQGRHDPQDQLTQTKILGDCSGPHNGAKTLLKWGFDRRTFVPQYPIPNGDGGLSLKRPTSPCPWTGVGKFSATFGTRRCYAMLPYLPPSGSRSRRGVNPPPLSHTPRAPLPHLPNKAHSATILSATLFSWGAIFSRISSQTSTRYTASHVSLQHYGPQLRQQGACMWPELYQQYTQCSQHNQRKLGLPLQPAHRQVPRGGGGGQGCGKLAGPACGKGS